MHAHRESPGRNSTEKEGDFEDQRKKIDGSIFTAGLGLGWCAVH